MWIGIAAVIGGMILYGAWTEWRKTVVRVRVELNDIRLGDKPEVMVLYDFSERLAGLRRDYGRRLAPLRPQIREIERTLVLAKAARTRQAERGRLVWPLFKEAKEAGTESRMRKRKVESVLGRPLLQEKARQTPPRIAFSCRRGIVIPAFPNAPKRSLTRRFSGV